MDELIREIAKAVQSAREAYEETRTKSACGFIECLLKGNDASRVFTKHLTPILAKLDRMTEIERLLDATTPPVYLRWHRGGHGDVISTTGRQLARWGKSHECGTPEAALLSLRPKPTPPVTPIAVTIKTLDGRKFTGTVVPDN